jgi:hypothetical protein
VRGGPAGLLAAALLALSAQALAAPEAPACDAGHFSPGACFPMLAYGGGIGIPNVIAWAGTSGNSGLAWGKFASIASGRASITFDGANMDFSVPSTPTVTGYDFDVGGLVNFHFQNTTINAINASVLSFDDAGRPFYPNSAWIGGNDNGNLVFGTGDGTSFQWRANNINVVTLIANSASLSNFIFANPASVITWTSGDTSGITGNGGAGLGLVLNGAEVNGATGIGVTINNTIAAATAGELLLSVQSAGVQKFGFKWDSGLTFSNTIAPAAADYGIGQDGSNLDFNVPTGKGFSFSVNGVQKYLFNGNGINLTSGNNFIVASGNGVQESGTNALLYFGSGTALSAILQSDVATGSSAIGIRLNNNTAFSTPGAKVVALQNGGVEVGAYKWDSGLTFSNTIAPAAADYGIGQDGTNLDFGVPTGKGFSFLVNGAAVFGVNAATTNIYSPLTMASNGNTKLIYSGTHGGAGGIAITFLNGSDNLVNTTAFTVNFNTTQTNATSKVLALQNGGVEVGAYKWDSGLTFSNTIAPAAADYGIGQVTGSSLSYNVPTGSTHKFLINGAGNAFVSSTQMGIATVSFFDTGGTTNTNRLASVTSGVTFGITSHMTDGASSIATSVNNTTVFATAGAKLLAVQNNGTEIMAVKWDSGLTFSNSAPPVSTDTGIGTDAVGGNLVINVLTGKNVNIMAAADPAWSFNGTDEALHMVGGGSAPAATNDTYLYGTGGAGTTSVFGNESVNGVTQLVVGDGTGAQQIGLTAATSGGTLEQGTAASDVATFTWSAVASTPTTMGGQVSASHYTGGSGIPTSATAGSGCGTSSAPTITGNDAYGTIGVTCGTAGAAGNDFVSATFAHAYNTNAPICVISCANAATCAGAVLSDHMANPTTAAIAVSCAGGVCTTGTLKWNYHCGAP